MTPVFPHFSLFFHLSWVPESLFVKPHFFDSVFLNIFSLISCRFFSTFLFFPSFSLSSLFPPSLVLVGCSYHPSLLYAHRLHSPHQVLRPKTVRQRIPNSQPNLSPAAASPLHHSSAAREALLSFSFFFWKFFFSLSLLTQRA